MLHVLALWGCGSTLQLVGAATLEPHQSEVTVSASGGRSYAPSVDGGGFSSTPVVQIAVRHGLKPDLDLGVRFGTGGVGADIRYRFLRTGPLHLATGAGTAFTADAFGGTRPIWYDLRAPLTAEVDITPGWSVAAGPSVLLRIVQDYRGIGGGVAVRPDLIGTFHLRSEWRPSARRFGFAFAVGAELIHEPLRGGPVGLEVGVQLISRTNPFARGVRLSRRQRAQEAQ